MQYTSKRFSIIFFIILCIGLIIAINLFIIQIVNGSFFRQLSQAQHTITIQTHLPRGIIIDCKNNPIALNRERIAAFITPKRIKKPTQLFNFLLKHFPDAIDSYNQHKTKQFLYIKRSLNNEEIELIKEQNIADIYLMQEPHRYYPYASLAPLVGITDIDNYGVMGIEQIFNSRLNGTSVSQILTKDARSGYFYIDKPETINSPINHPLQLSIDAHIQFLATEELYVTMEKFQAKQGAVIIMNPDNGQIVCMSSLPTFDPNDLKKLETDHTTNICIAQSYELGSVIKIFAALAACEEHVVAPDELIDCKNSKTTLLDGRIINTWRADGLLNFIDVIAYSNNIGIAQLAKRVGTRLYDHYRKLGFGNKTGIELPAEQAGFITHPKNWSKQSIISLSYGYEIRCTLLQLACAFCIIANDGKKINPTIFTCPLAEKSGEQLYSVESCMLIKTILEKTVQYGTGRHAKIPGIEVMLKTGTANLLVNGLYDSTANLFTCAGIIKKDNYQRVIVVFIKESNQKNIYASTVTVPLVKRIAQTMLIHDRIVN